jgi:hypothetical protein
VFLWITNKGKQMNRFESITNPLTWVTAMSLVALAAGCGGGATAPGPSTGGGGVGGVAPTVTSVAPLSNAIAVPINTKTVTAAFAGAMDTLTLTPASFTLACPAGMPVTGAVTYVDASKLATLTLPGTANLPPRAVCTATVTTAAKNSAGIALASNFVWSFTTGLVADTTPPTVTATSSANGATGVLTNTKIGATFSEALDPLTITTTTFTLKQGTTPVSGTVSYSGVNAVFAPTTNLAASTAYTATITSGAKDLAGNGLVTDFVWGFTTAAATDTTPPTIVSTSPADLAVAVCSNKTINASFSEPMDTLTITNATFTLAATGGASMTGVVAYDAVTKIATFKPAANLMGAINYTATIVGGTSGVKDLAGNALAMNKVTTFTTNASTCTTAPALGAAATFGGFGGHAGLTNQGNLTVINGNIGTTAASTLITGFHDTGGNTYTETCPAGAAAVGCGLVNGTIYTATAPPGSVPGAVAAAALLDANTAFTNLSPAALPGGIDVSTFGGGAGELGGRTLAPGIYKSAPGTFAITSLDLTLDAGGDANAVWVFQMATSLTVGIPGPTGARSVILIGGALAKNVFWQVGTAATINGAGGGTMVGTIIGSAGVTISTAGNAAITTLNGRALGLNASVTMVNTVINVPAP